MVRVRCDSSRVAMVVRSALRRVSWAVGFAAVIPVVVKVPSLGSGCRIRVGPTPPVSVTTPTLARPQARFLPASADLTRGYRGGGRGVRVAAVLVVGPGATDRVRE